MRRRILRSALWIALALTVGFRWGASALAAGNPMPLAAPASAASPPSGAAAKAVSPPSSPAMTASQPAAAPAGDPDAGPGDGTAADEPQEKPLQYAISYRMDARAGTQTGQPGVQLDGLEAQVLGSYGSKWDFAIQVPLHSQFASRGRGMHFGNLYAIRKWRLGAPTLKFGQFVVPYGNLTSFDTHDRIIQSLSRYSLGVRIDPGIEGEGYVLGDGDSEWQMAVTSGNGPYRLDRRGAPLVTGRLSHKFEQQGNTLQFGLTAAAGTLPVFSVNGEPVSAAGSPVVGWADKRRLALDAEVEHGVDLFRFEGDVGTDGGRPARGLWLGWTRPLNANDALETAAETWQQPEGQGRLLGAWLGVEHRLDGSRTVRAAFRWSRSHEEGLHHEELSLTAQLVRQF